MKLVVNLPGPPLLTRFRGSRVTAAVSDSGEKSAGRTDYPESVSRTLNFVAGLICQHLKAVGPRWRKLEPARQALLKAKPAFCG